MTQLMKTINKVKRQINRSEGGRGAAHSGGWAHKSCQTDSRYTAAELRERIENLSFRDSRSHQSRRNQRRRHVFGNITRLDNALENLAGSLQAEQNSLEETKAQLENARTELATPFAREEELAEKTARLKELNILLNTDEKDKTLMDDTPDEGEDVPARRVAELAR